MKKLSILLIGLLFSAFVFSEEITINNQNFEVNVLSSDDSQTIIEYNFGMFERTSVNIDGEAFYHLFLEKESSTFEKGCPALPKITRSIIIPDHARMEAKIIDSKFAEYQMKVAPSKGMISRKLNPDDVPYEFSTTYNLDEFYPGNIEELGSPYILRDFRGAVITVYPFSYNPQTETLRVYYHLVLEVNNVGYDNVNIKNRSSNKLNSYFEYLYSNHFINFDRTRYEQIEEHGRMIVISHGSFMDSMEPFVDWKNQKGIQTEIHNVLDIGTTANQIKDFIQSEYDEDNGLTFVQLIGDRAQIPTLSGGGGDSDPSYALLEGGDTYPDIFVGRFSAETVEQAETQVQRTIYYERDIVDGEWLHKGCGIASNQGPGDDNETDDEHIDNIREKLLNFTYTEVDQIYDPNGSVAEGMAALNEGRSIVNYCGHGSPTSWGNGAPLGNSDVNALTNDNMLPFIVSVACNNGEFGPYTCFAEAWLRATNDGNGNPTGAIAMYASTVSQSWNPPMRAQDEAIDLLVGAGPYEGLGTQKTSIGGLCFNGSCNMMDVYGNGGVDMFKTWIIFGDASLQVRTDTPEAMTINHLPTIFIGMTTFDVSTGVEDALVCLSDGDDFYASGYTDESGNVTLELTDMPQIPMDLTLTISAFNKITSVETVEVIPNDGAYLVISDYTFNAGGDDVIEFGETVNLSVTIENVGTDPANEVEMTLSIDDEFITLTDAAETIGDVAAGESIVLNNAFSFDVSNAVPDDYPFNFEALMNGVENSWTGIINLTAYALLVSFSSVTVEDGDNFVLDPGETADLTVSLYNDGGAAAHNINAILSYMLDDDMIIVNDSADELAFLEAYSYGNFTFNITASEDAPIGQVAPFEINADADNEYSMTDYFSLTIGLCVEDFETGDFSSFDWYFDGQHEWFISSEAYEEQYSAQSGDLLDSQFSSLKIDVSVLMDDEIKFYKKVSSENNYDYLQFFIDDNMVGEWCGEIDWSQEIFPVTYGEHTFEWRYEKDGSVSSGSDCAWIDFIEFPPIGIPIPPELEVSVDEIELDLDPNTIVTDEFTLTNIGGGTLTYNISLEETRDMTGSYVECSAEGFTPGETTTWTFTVYNGSPDGEWITDVFIGFPAGVIVNSSTNFVGGTGGDLESNGVTGDGVEINWHGEDSSGWGMVYPDESATAEVNLTISGGFAGDMVLEWQIDGDVWGGDPHSVNGTMTIGSLAPPITWIQLDSYTGNLDPNETDEITVTFDSNDIPIGDYTCNLIINDNRETTIIPVTLHVYNLSEEEDVLPKKTELTGNYPNPFNPAGTGHSPGTTISYNLTTDDEGIAEILIYNTKGQKVRTLKAGNREAGYHTIVWNGKDSCNRTAASGVYFYKLEAGGKFTSARKMILMK